MYYMAIVYNLAIIIGGNPAFVYRHTSRIETVFMTFVKIPSTCFKCSGLLVYVFADAGAYHSCFYYLRRDDEKSKSNHSCYCS